MDVIEVDPKLFVTCRLCLEDLGQYQIVPSIQQLIKYCFDIDVEPFDGLPQLICVKCKEILNNFHSIKKIFCEKQSNLLNKVIKKDNKDVNDKYLQPIVQPQQDTVSSSQQNAENIDETINSKPKKKRVLHSSSSSDFESEQSYLVAKPKPKKKYSRLSLKKPSMPWEVDYNKQVVCKICNNRYPTKRSVWNHIRCHTQLKTKYKDIFYRQCTVNLKKIDDKPNITGVSTMVVHSINKIVEPGTSYFYTLYSKETDSTNTDDLNKIESGKSNTKRLINESTDEDEQIVSKRRPRARRIVSRSSNETVVIESNSNKILSDIEDSKTALHDTIDGQTNTDQCINIDDSSDSESEKSKLESGNKFKQPMEAQLVDYKIIQGIISMCVNAYHKKHETGEVDGSTNVKKNDKVQVSSESQLKHKVLSIGRKIINKQGFNCTGLLRYMEHKNLEIVWMTKTLQSYSNKETNYIRILTKLRGHETKDDKAWVNISKTMEAMPPDELKVPEPVLKNLLTAPIAKPFRSDSLSEPTDTSASIIETSQLAKIEKCQPEQVQEKPHVDTLPAMLYLDHDASSSDSKKLLNANPVANPKQLPKKLGPANESRSNKVVSQQNTCHTNNDDSNFCMPIITSTTSLATIPNKENHEDANRNSNVASTVLSTNKEPHAPRIKVKPASELMSERILNSLMKEQSSSVTNSNMAVSQIENSWRHQLPLNVYVPNMAPQVHVAPQPIQIVQLPCVNISPTYQILPSTSTSNMKPDYVILDTVQFPNTKTESPFKYLKDVLQTHNLLLLDPCEGLTPDFVCLIKFKVLFKQEANKDQPVVLCLSLFCLRNTFCLKVRDRNQENIDINKISANWQWEILQIYTGDVTNKVLFNAQKHSTDTYEYTKRFVCLLKSINCKKKL